MVNKKSGGLVPPFSLSLNSLFIFHFLIREGISPLLPSPPFSFPFLSSLFPPYHSPRLSFFPPLSSPFLSPFFSPPFAVVFLFFIFGFWFLDRVGIFFSLLLSCYKSSTKKLAHSRFLGFQEKVKVATLYYIVLHYYLFFLKAKKLLAKGGSTPPPPQS